MDLLQQGSLVHPDLGHLPFTDAKPEWVDFKTDNQSLPIYPDPLKDG